jgi:hypothetical protein
MRAAGAIIVAASLLSLLMMAHHPSGSTRDMAVFVEQIARVGALNRVVHGALIALLAALLFGFAEFSRVFGAGRPLVRAALVAYAIGTAADIGAATINGFAVGRVAAHYAGADTGALEQLRALLHLGWAMNQSLADLGEVARAIAIVLWSLAILRTRTQLLLGASGVLAGGSIALAQLGGWLTLDVHGMLLAVLCASAWNVALGVQLLRGRLSAAAHPVA